MTHSFTTIGKGHYAPCLPATQESWNQARQSSELAQLCKQIEQTEDADLQKQLKERLPVWTPRCGEFNNNHRSQNDAVYTLNRQMFDIDKKGHTDDIMALMEDRDGEKYIGNFLIIQIEESVRRGTHVLVIPPEGMVLDEAQHEFSKLINLPVDPAVKNVAGCIYMVPEDHVRYQSPKFFEAEEAHPVAQPTPTTQHPTPTTHHPTPTTQHPATYDGIPYSTLVECLAEQLGGVPVHGSRNNFIFSMACHLRYVCNDDAEWIMSVLPTYGEDRAKMERTVHSAVSRAQSRYIPEIVQRAISIARVRSCVGSTIASGEAGEGGLLYSSPNPPEMPEHLPRLIQLLVSKVDAMYRPAVAQAVFPPLGAHLHGVRTRYIDNSEADLGGFMTVCMAKQSIGKGCLNKPIDLIMEDIRQRDDYSRELEKQWKQQCKSSKANEKKPPRPNGMCVQFLMSNMTNAALVQRLLDAEAAGDKFLYTRLDEIEMLDQIKASGGATASEIIRLAHNQAQYGQERVGIDSVTGTPPLRFNFNASTTVPTGQKYFAKGLTNGTLSRLTFSTIIKPLGRRGIPRFGDYDEEFRLQLSSYINNLNSATGLIECPQADEMTEVLCEENADFSELSDDDAFETLSFRACRMAHDKAKLLYIAHGYQWDETIADFCRWSMQYDLWLKMRFFGSKMREETQASAANTNCGPRNMLDMLPTRFSAMDLAAVYHAQARQGDYMQLIYTWTNRGYIEQDKSTQEYIKTEKYLSRHGNNTSPNLS